MTIRNLEFAFRPQSVALVGASPEPGSVGRTVVGNLTSGGFSGPIWLVNPNHTKIDGKPCFSCIASLPEAPDLAIIATPPQTVPGLIAELGSKGTRAVVVITAGIDARLRQSMLDAAKPYCLRIIGPNCIGLLLPNLGINASFSHIPASPGHLAMLSQSGALVGGILDWAASRHVGFSTIVSMGDMADVDVGDLLDFLAADISTHAILLYLETIPAARKFMSAARSAARAKPVVVIKSGRFAASARAAATHTGALAGADNVIDAAFRRAGMLRVSELEDLFTAAETLTWLRPIKGNTLSILTNGGGAGVLGVDQLTQLGGQLAPLGEDAKAKLDAILPANWSRANPVDIIGDADAERYQAAMEVMLDDPASDALLVMNCPTALTSSTEAARGVIAAVQTSRNRGQLKPVLCNWLGADGVAQARVHFAEAGIPSYESPDDAVRGFINLWKYTCAQQDLVRMTPSKPDRIGIDDDAVRKIFAAAAAAGRQMLSEPEAKAVLAASGIPTVSTQITRDPSEVELAARTMLENHDAIVVKILSDDITHKSDAGGVRLDIKSPSEAREVAEEMLERISQTVPGARIQGFTVQAMVTRPGAYELIAGITEDPLFGPVLLFGAGGTATEILADTSVSLPPIDSRFAHDLIERTEVYKLLKGYRDQPPADIDAITDILMRLSQLVVDCPAIRELDINPLLADENGAIALDARIRIDTAEIASTGPNPHLAIRPYPSEWETRKTIKGGDYVVIRPIRPADEHLYGVFIDSLEKEDIRFRFFAPKKEFSHQFIARFTQIDYARAMGFVALNEDETELLGVARLSADPDYKRAEYAVIVRSDLKGRGLGWTLMNHLIAYASAEGLDELYGDVLTVNSNMLKMARKLGFDVLPSEEGPGVLRVVLRLPVN